MARLLELPADLPQSRLFDPGLRPLCAQCPWRRICGAADTSYACHPDPQKAGGGRYALHPNNPDTADHLANVRGPEYTSVRAQPIALPTLPPYLPQVRNLRSLRSNLTEPIYAVRAQVVVGCRPDVLPAATLRKTVGLSPEQQIILLLFDDDEILERLLTADARLLRQLAEAGYDVVVPPSYSAWLPRPRPDFMFSAKRSLEVFAALQRLGIPSMPRLLWVIEHDVRRAADWVLENRAVEIIALDLQTYAKRPREYAQQLKGLKLFDRLTGRRLKYLINGIASETTIEAAFAVVPDRRVCITNATTAAPFASQDDSGQLQLKVCGRDRTGRTFSPRCADQRRTIRRAAESARACRSEARHRHIRA